MALSRRTLSLVATATTAPLALLLATGAPAGATPPPGPAHAATAADRLHPSLTTDEPDPGEEGGETEEIMDRAEQYAAVRTAPAASVSSRAFTAARAQAAALPRESGTWRELTDRPYDSDAVNYRDPFWSNSSGGAGLVSGRMTSLAADGATVYAGAADGGVWKSTDRGAHWTPIFDEQSRLSVGALAVDPADHSIWVGTGEANTAFENYAGDGVYRSGDGGRTWQLVGNRLDNSLVSRISFAGGYVFAATSLGLVRRSTLDPTAAWTTVLKPDPDPTGSPYRGSWISDVRVRPGTAGKDVVAVLGWRGGSKPEDTAYNGFYVSHSGGAKGTFSRVATPSIGEGLGRTSLDYTPRGDRLFAVVEDTRSLTLKGVYRSDSGDAAGPWTLVAGPEELAKAPNTANPYAAPGAQAWYNQYVTVDPKNPRHLYLGLEEIYESSDGGQTWTTIGPYWNFGKPCQSPRPFKDTCPKTTHPDQHAAIVAPDGTAYFANDGGLYSRPASRRSVVRWDDLNATLHTLQYYYAGIGAWPTGGDAVWGGLQDNGTSLLKPRAEKMVSPFGGDGGDVIVDPKDGRRAVNEYVYMATARTENGGLSNGTTRSYTTMSPTCAAVIALEFDPEPCDPAPRFIAPLEADPKDSGHWVAGGQKIWDNQGAGWKTVCTDDTCSWKPVHDLGAGASTSAVAVVGKTIYAGWCGNGCNPGGTNPFVSGIDTNYGGHWHRITAPNLPNRIPTSFNVDYRHPGHVYVTYGAFSRRWIPGGGVGHVFESTDGGGTWKDVSGNLPDAPANDVLVTHGKLVVATDVGVFTAATDATRSWKRLGADLPNASTNDLALAPSKGYVVAATHGRGLWRYDLS